MFANGENVMQLSDFAETIEGKTRLLVPKASLSSKVPPTTPAFFNPAARLSRDISILAYRAFAKRLKGERTFADSFAGIGARALRVAVEAPEINSIYANDINATAIEAARHSARINSVESKCHFSTNEVCKFLTDHATEQGERFGIVDLDPFGTPAKYLDCVLRSVLDNGLVSITATDTAVLCGIYPEVCRRRYYGSPLNTSYGNEIAIRLLTSLIALTASRLEIGIRPIFAHSTMHYLRVYASINVSSSQANRVFENIGYVKHCFGCGGRIFFRSDERDRMKNDICELCGDKMRSGGKLWSGRLFEREFVNEMIAGASDTDARTEKICKKIFSPSLDELDDIPCYFRGDEISSRLKTNPASIQVIIEKLTAAGFRASKTSLNPAAFKTDARIDEIISVMK